MIGRILMLLGPNPEPGQPVPTTRSERGLIAVTALIGALLGSSIFGLVVNPSGIGTSLRNALTIPMLLLISAIVCLPIILLVSRLLLHAPGQTSALLVGYSLSLLGGAAVLAAASPIVALYQHSSSWAGPVVAKVVIAIAVFVGLCLFFRTTRRFERAGPGQSLGVGVGRWATGGLLMVAQLAVMAQLASTVEPVFRERTRFGQGIDGLESARGAEPNGQPRDVEAP